MKVFLQITFFMALAVLLPVSAAHAGAISFSNIPIPGFSIPFQSLTEFKICQIRRLFCGTTGIVFVAAGTFIIGIGVLNNKMHWGTAILMIAGAMLFYNASDFAALFMKSNDIVSAQNPLCDCSCNIDNPFADNLADEIKNCAAAMHISYPGSGTDSTGNTGGAVTDPNAPTSGGGSTLYWKGMNVIAKDDAGNASSVYYDAYVGVAVAGGKLANEIDYDAAAGKSESITLAFPVSVNGMDITLGQFASNENGHSEVAKWEAFDKYGNLVGSGLLWAGKGETVGTIRELFHVDFGGSAASVKMSAVGYDNDPTIQVGDSSDFTVYDVAY